MFRRTYYVQRAERRSAVFEEEDRRVPGDKSFSSFMTILFVFLIVCMCIVVIANWQLLFVAEEEMEKVSKHQESESQTDVAIAASDLQGIIDTSPVQNISEDASWTPEGFEQGSLSTEPSVGSETQVVLTTTEFIETTSEKFETEKMSTISTLDSNAAEMFIEIRTPVTLRDILRINSIGTKQSSALIEGDFSREDWSLDDIDAEHRTISPAMRKRVPFKINSNEIYKLLDPNE